MNDGRNFFIWLIFMVAIFIILGVLETALEVPDICLLYTSDAADE